MQLPDIVQNEQTTNKPSINLSEVDFTRNAKYLRLFTECAKECGVEAAVTLAVFAWKTSEGKYYFGELGVLATLSGVSEPTIDRHMAKLEKHGYIKNHGRQSRRTATRSIPMDVHRRMKCADWQLKLPIWALALGMSRGELMLLAISFHRTTGILGDDTSFDRWESIKDGEYDWTMKWIVERTGLTEKTIRSSRKKLVERGLISDEYDTYGRICLTPTSDYVSESVYVTSDMLSDMDTRYVGLLDTDEQSHRPEGKSDARPRVKVMLGNGKSDASTICMTSDLYDPNDLYAVTNATEYKKETSSKEEEDKTTEEDKPLSEDDPPTPFASPKPTEGGRPLWSKLVHLSGRTTYHSNKEVWKFSIDSLINQGRTPSEIERVFLYAIKQDRWFSKVDSKRDFPIGHFVKNFDSLIAKAGLAHAA